MSISSNDRYWDWKSTSQPNQHMIPGIPKSQNSHVTTKINKLESNDISVPPLNTTRLQPTRYKTKNAIMSILKRGEVVIEFVKYRSKYNADRITDICWISGDGMSIIVHQPDSGRGLPVNDHPPELPPVSSDCIFTYHTLPSKHHKKYVYAARFVDLVKSKTPKVTYYSTLAKFALMETLEDFETTFYDGSRVTKSPGENIKVYDKHGRQITSDEGGQALIEHQQACFNHCLSISKALEVTELSRNHTCFPIVIGRRPTTDIQSQFIANKRDNNILTSSTPKSQQGSSINFSLSSISSLGYDISAKQQQREFFASQQNIPIKRVNIPGLGTATEVRTIQFYI